MIAFAHRDCSVASATDEHAPSTTRATSRRTRWIWPEQAELIYGTLASVIIFGLLSGRPGRWPRRPSPPAPSAIQAELDESAQAKTDAEADATRIRQALGDIEGERQRLLAEADAQAEALLADGRARLEAEVADLEAKADADIAAAAGRTSDELRNEIARLASAAADRVVERSLDDDTQQRLIEDFIARGSGSMIAPHRRRHAARSEATERSR